MPDLYEASQKMTDWFLHFVKDHLQTAKKARLVKLWMGESPHYSRIKKKKINLSAFDPGSDYESEYDVIYDFVL